MLLDRLERENDGGYSWSDGDDPMGYLGGVILHNFLGREEKD